VEACEAFEVDNIGQGQVMPMSIPL
jgi:hypothetical protein